MRDSESERKKEKKKKMDTKTAQNTSPGTVVVQYAFRGNTRKQRELLIPDYENNFTCAMFKDAVFSSNEIHFATLLPIQLCVCVKTELDELRGKKMCI